VRERSERNVVRCEVEEGGKVLSFPCLSVYFGLVMEEEKIPVRAWLYIALAMMQFRTVKWFTSPGPQQKAYKWYVCVMLIAHILGIRAGQAVADSGHQQ